VRETELFHKLHSRIAGTDSVRPIIVDERDLPLAFVAARFKVVPAVLTVGDYVIAEDLLLLNVRAYSDLISSFRSGPTGFSKFNECFSITNKLSSSLNSPKLSNSMQ
jgi:ERCC4-type nuclease